MYCVDNVPISLVPELVRLVRRVDETRRVAVCVDAREGQWLAQLPEVQARLAEDRVRLEVIFVEAARDVLVRRYAETRRVHPMGELPDAIDRERDLLAPMRQMAAVVIDTSTLGSRQLRQIVRDRWAPAHAMRVVLQSFAYQSGVPSEADVVFDCRFLENPHYKDDLRPLSGLDEPVTRFVLDQADAREFLDLVERTLRFQVPRAAARDCSYLTFAIGCTGGRHRSVALVEALKQRLAAGAPLGNPAPRVFVRHRDLGGNA
jgi:UPF0042 nucleotide-binding protein